MAFLLLVLTACTPSDPSSESPSTDDTATPDDRFVATGVTAMDGTDFGLGYDDLEALAPIIGDATLVGIGEPEHWSNEFAKVRARVIPWLVEEQGFRAVAFDGGWFWGDTGRPYVEEGKGEIRDAMSSLGQYYWTSEPAVPLIEWLREWNLAHPDDGVTWFGYDIEWFPDNFPAVRDIVRATDPDAEAELWNGVTDCIGGTYQVWTDFNADTYGYGVYYGTESYTEEQRVECQVGLDAIQAWVDANEDRIAAAVGPEAPTLADVALISLSAVQKEYAWWDDRSASYGAHDEAMAQVLQRMWALRAPDERLVVFDHNNHLFRDRESLSYSMDWYPSMGKWLDEALGDRYVAIAQLSSSTTSQVTGADAVTIHVAPFSLEADLEALTDSKALIVDVSAATDAGVIRSGELQFGAPSISEGTPADQMRAAIWVESSPAMEFWDHW